MLCNHSEEFPQADLAQFAATSLPRCSGAAIITSVSTPYGRILYVLLWGEEVVWTQLKRQHYSNRPQQGEASIGPLFKKHQ